ncbi:site-specific integrase [Enterococcus sp. 669A]|uniref:Site-specific integrase n=1 Tax=Candidatus Enterococcus moelleringii TaxID=2815325 RepID=A0ABS3LBX0_9ENTE|nr:site-specific integrase [Enterococcus sp. 669A]MBO1307131.1 site-specific integrase [Enterococcus sp. 669A]
MGRTGECIYLRCDERWEGRYHKGRTAKGKLIYGSVYGDSYDEVKELLEPIKKSAEIMMRLYGKSIMSFKDWSAYWVEEKKATVKAATYASYMHKLKEYLWENLGRLSLYQIDDQAIAKAIEAWRYQRELAWSSIKVVFRLLKQILDQAVKQKILEVNPCEGFPLPKPVKEKVQALTLKEQKRLQEVVDAQDDVRAQSVTLAMGTGMRIGEIAALTWEEVDFDQSLIYVNNTYQRVLVDGNKTELQLGSAKTRAAQRIIPMSKSIKKLLLELKKQANGATFVFTTNGKPCEPRLLTYHFHKIREKAGLLTVHFHQLRHTFATRCLETNADIMSVSQLLGHSSTKMTLDTYAHSNQDQKIAAIMAMDQAIA